MVLDFDPQEHFDFCTAAAPDNPYAARTINVHAIGSRIDGQSNTGGEYSAESKTATIIFEGDIRRTNYRYRHEMQHHFDYESWRSGIDTPVSLKIGQLAVDAKKIMLSLMLAGLGLEVLLPVSPSTREWIRWTDEAVVVLYFASLLPLRLHLRELRANKTARKFANFSPFKLVPKESLTTSET